MPEELVAPKAPRKELGLDDSRSNTPQGFAAPGAMKTQNAAASVLLGEDAQLEKPKLLSAGDKR